jgi:thiol-disulfide isomerase/thioredoxin
MKIPKILFILLLFPVFFSAKQDRDVPIYDFDQFKPHLEKNNDTTYIINFWASWCKPCVEEMPDFQEIYDNYKHQKVSMTLVSLDLPSQVNSRVIPFLQENKITAPVVLLDDPDQNRWINAVDSSWTGSIPATLIYGPEGRTFTEKKLNYKEIEQIIQKTKFD